MYNTALSAVAFVLCGNGHYDRALNFNTKLLERTLSDKKKQTAEGQKKEILYSQEVIGAIPELENKLKDIMFASNEWFATAFKLTSAYFRIKDSEKYTDLLNRMYQSIPQNDAAKEEYYFAILGALYNVCLDQGDFDSALKYALEKKEYISAIPNIPEKVSFDCMNNIVVAKLKSNKLDGIYDNWNISAQLCINVFGQESEAYAIQLHNLGRAFQLDGKYDEAKKNYLEAIALHRKVKGAPMAKTVQYLMETNKQIIDAELEL